MTQYRTGNPLGSMAPKDLFDNAQNVDNWANGEEPFYEDRFGVQRRSFSGMNFEFEAAQNGRTAAFNAQMASLGYISKGAYATGVVLEAYNEYVAVPGIVSGGTPAFYRPGPGATLPLTLEGDWAIDGPKLLQMDADDVLRQELAGPDGATRVGYGAGTVEQALDELTGRPVTRKADTISDLVSAAGQVGEAVMVVSYYDGWAAESPFVGPRGGGLFVWDDSSVAADNGVTVFEVPDVATGRWRRVLRDGTVSLWDAGCVTTAGVDNHDRMLAALYSEASIVEVPIGQFDTSPLRISIDASNTSLIGYGRDSCLSLIGNITAQAGLLHIPKVGDAYGGTYAGPSNFTIDMIRLRGDQATGTVSTTGLVIYDGDNIQVGTIWSHGFYKSGMLIAGNPVGVNVERFYGYENGNQAGASTGGQGFAIVSDTTSYPAVNVEYAECWANGLNNFGQGLDLSRGNVTLGTMVFHDNGASGMKVVTPNKVKIGTLICLNNNLHAGQTFGAFYTNGDFGEIQIGRFEVESPAGSGLVVVNSGRLKIGTFTAKNCPSSGITTPIPAGKDATIHIDNIEVDTVTATAVSLAAPGVLDFHSDNIMLRNTTAGGVTANVRNLYIGELITKECGAVSLTIQGTPESAFVQKVRAHSSTYAGSALAVASGVVNAAIISARRGGTYTATLSDSGTTTYKPNIV